MTKPITYKDAGVDIDAGDSLVKNIKSVTQSTYRPEVLSKLGGYAGFFSLQSSKVQNPVLVSSTDGVGTKLKLALDTGLIDTIGQDLVAMCVNDLICCGAEPLFFLDYYATGKLNVEHATQVIQSIASSLKSINCSLLGGETAEMPGMYQKEDFDLAGFAVGIVDEKKIITGDNIQSGQKIIGITSSGFHSNGYSLVRKIIEAQNLDLNQKFENNTTLAQVLLAPTKLYVNAILKVLSQFPIYGLAHITGGGITENLPRILPQNIFAQIHTKLIPTPKVFHYFQEQGQIPQNEMWRVFNMGIGMIAIVSSDEEESILQLLNQDEEQAFSIGEILTQKDDNQTRVEYV